MSAPTTDQPGERQTPITDEAERERGRCEYASPDRTDGAVYADDMRKLELRAQDLEVLASGLAKIAFIVCTNENTLFEREWAAYGVTKEEGEAVNAALAIVEAEYKAARSALGGEKA